MKILFADKFPEQFLAQLSHHSCTTQPELDENTLTAAIADTDILVVRSTKVNQQTIAAAKNLKLIIRAGAGTNTIDKVAARQADVSVCNTPGKNAVAVAELAMGLLLAVDRQIPANNQDIKQAKWNKSTYSKSDGIYGKSVGVVGFGSIGQAFASRAKAFGLAIHAVDRSGKYKGSELAATYDLTLHQNLTELAKSCDIISLHTPSSEETKHLINKSIIDAMQENSIIINTSRGEVIDEDALIKGMDEKNIRAGVDVYHGEPGSGQAEFESDFAKHPNVTGTHHIGASTTQAQNAVAQAVIEIIEDFKDGRITNCVN